MAREHRFRLHGTAYTVTVDGAQVTFGPDDAEPQTIALEFDGDGCAVAGGGPRRRWAAVRARDGVWVCVDGYTAFLELVEPGTEDAGSAASADEVRAPMTGTVVHIAAEVGATVTAGDVLVTLTAMKMEYKLEAPRDGVVARVNGAAGEQVELGQVLVALEPA